MSKSPYTPSSYHERQAFYDSRGRTCESCLQAEGAVSRFTGIPIKLARAHLDQNTKNNYDGNLAALCHWCHTQWDIEYKKHGGPVAFIRGRLSLSDKEIK